MEPSVFANLGSLQEIPTIKQEIQSSEVENLKFFTLPRVKKTYFFFHSLKVKAAFNEQKRRYEIWTNSQCRKHQEVLICYGPHDNHRLLLEYGFVAMDNPHSSVYVSPGGIYGLSGH